MWYEDEMSDLGDRRDPLDLVHLAAQTGGEPALQRDLLDLFIVQSAEFVARIYALARLDPAAASDLAHRLNGSARAIGAFELAGAAAALEGDLAAGDGAEALEPMAAALSRALDAVEAFLRALPPRRGLRPYAPPNLILPRGRAGH
jgi:HPt (histidine-containing phosphotransfer) domain-containing protein